MNTGSGPCLRPWPPWKSRYPGAVEGRVYSVREVNADAGLERALLADGAAADMAFLASHGSIQNLYCFSRLWKALAGRPVYFTSTMGDELAELSPESGLEPAVYAALDAIIRRGARRIWKGWCCARSTLLRRGLPLHPRARPGGRGLYAGGPSCRWRGRGRSGHGWPPRSGRSSVC